MNHLHRWLAFFLFALFSQPAWATPLLVDFGPNIVVSGVTQTSDGTTYLVGYEVDPSSQASSAIIIGVSADGSYSLQTLGALAGGTSSEAAKISGDYVVGWSTNGAGDKGVAWSLNDIDTAIPIDPVVFQGRSDSRLNGLNSSGQYAGTAVGKLFAISGEVGGATTQLPKPPVSGAIAFSISEQGTVVGVLNDQDLDGLFATVWQPDGTRLSLTNPFVFAGEIGQVAAAFDISPNSAFIGGAVAIFDEASEQLQNQAAVWSGDQWGTLTMLTDELGNPLLGEVLGVLDDGYAVGRSNQGGFIWHSGWDFAQMFNSWAFNEFGISIPTWVTSVNDVFSNGSELSFALQGSAYLVQAPINTSAVPEPATYILLLAFAPILWALKLRQASHFQNFSNCK